MTAADPFFSRAGSTAADADSQQGGCQSSCPTVCRSEPHVPVGGLSAEELDAHIVDLGRLMAKVHAEGDRDAAAGLQRQMYAAIRSRSPGHQQAMEQAIYRRMEAACFFSSDEAHS